jgi:beta-mannosidase
MLKFGKYLWPAWVLLVLAPQIGRSQTGPSNAPPKLRMQINTNWKFRQVGKTDWHPATVPGCVHTDLMSNNLIEDPFYRDNEAKLQWIGKTDWEYETTLEVNAELLRREKIELVFEGLDTYANVYLNDAPVLDADNMFRTWRVDCKRLLKSGPNSLRIRFRSPINEVLPVMAKIQYQLPAVNDQGEKTSPFTRKAPYHYGWDWGPRFVTSGVWRPVSIEAWDGARIADFHILQREVNKETARLTAEVEVSSSSALDAVIIIEDATGKTVASPKRVKLAAGDNQIDLDFDVSHPSLWWPNGLGPHPLYEFRARLLMGDKPVDQSSTRVGLRSLELRRQLDQWGKSFEFVINGVPVFAKGGNWIPADSFPTRITKAKYRNLLESVRDSNMNMIRVWGGGIYEPGVFYDLCDEMGIMVWQEFMFACSMYPGDQAFLDSVRHEAIDNVKRLRDHASIVAWVGNNEVETAWKHWGWKQNLPSSVWEDYKRLFHGVLPEVCSTLDPSRPYWPSSPSSNLEDDPDSQRNGDVHYWAVWHASKPFSEYEQQWPRFMSEYGFQSFPSIETVNSYTLPSEHDITSPVMLVHQKHPRGNQLIREYMLRDYPQPKDFESFLYVSQVLQAEGIRVGAEHLRRIMPRNMGSLYWQIDDCWPVASWSSIDYYGRWKALQYYAKRFYAEMLVSPHVENGKIEVYVVSDRTKPTPAQLTVTLMDFQGDALKEVKNDVTIDALDSKSYWSIPVAELLKGKDPKTLFLHSELSVEGKVISTSEHYFLPYKNLTMPQPHIAADVTAGESGLEITLSSDKLARDVYLSAPGRDGFFSDNYFDLIPGKKVVVHFRPSGGISASAFRESLKVRSLADAF